MKFTEKKLFQLFKDPLDVVKVLYLKVLPNYIQNIAMENAMGQ